MVKINLDAIKPNSTVTEIMAQPNTFKNIKEIIEGVRSLLKEAKTIGAVTTTTETLDEKNPTDMIPPGQGITTAQALDFAKKFLDSMIAQGLGDKTIDETIKSLPFTIKQIRGVLK